MFGMGTGEAFESILGAAQAGADWAFAKLYVEFNPPLERYFAARAPTSREDLASETWVGAARGLGEFRGDERRFRSWLFTIAYRRLVDHWKQEASAPDLLDPAAMRGWVGSDDPEESAVEAMSALEAARRIVGCLSADQADVVLLRLLGDLDVDQVAEVLGKQPGAVRALQHRALQKLKKEISLEGVTP
jgi:RNA polymerase sigma factor (sigma-70 family)